MTPAAKRILAGLNDALAIARGEADPATYCIHSFGPDASAPDHKKGAAAEAWRPSGEVMLSTTTDRADARLISAPGRTDGIQRAQTHAEEWYKSSIARGQREVFSNEFAITPQMATLLLRKNPDNRNLKKTRILEIKADLEAGRYALNGEPIIVSKDGLLNDGQHRLIACVESGVTFRSMVTFGVARSSRLTLDQGGARTVADYLDMQGDTDNTKVTATVARMLWQWKRSGRLFNHGGPKSRCWPTKAESLEIVADCGREIERHIKAVTQTSKLVGSFSFTVFCRVVLARANESMGPVFVDRLLDGANLKSESPIFLLRERFINDPKMRQPERFEAVVRAWNAMRKGKTLSKIQIMGSVPSIEG